MVDVDRADDLFKNYLRGDNTRCLYSFEYIILKKFPICKSVALKLSQTLISNCIRYGTAYGRPHLGSAVQLAATVTATVAKKFEVMHSHY